MNWEIEDKKNKDNPNKEDNLTQQQLQTEITNLENKPNKTQEEQALLDSKQKELGELLKRQSDSNANTAKHSDKIGLYVGCGMVGIILVLIIFIMARIRKKNRK